MPQQYLDPARTRLAVLGSPIAHSLSPVLHAAAYGVLGVDLEYGRHEVASGDLEAFVGGLDDSWRGLSLTMPLKREVLPLLDRTTPLVDELGVANTIAFRDEGGRVVRAGANTDVDGIVRPVEALRHPAHDDEHPAHDDEHPAHDDRQPAHDDERPAPGSAAHPARHHIAGEAAVLGGGATAASALSACTRLGADSVRVFLRDTGKAGELIDLAMRIGVTLEVHPLTDLVDAGPLGFVVSTLPGGAADQLDLTPSGPEAVLFDVAYEPWPTAIATRWRDRGGRVLNGLDMLTEQAIGQIRFFLTGDQDAPLPDEPAVRRAMRSAVGLPERIGA